MGLEPVEQLVCESWQGVHIKCQYSSVGRASASYAAGRRFDPGYWHQSSQGLGHEMLKNLYLTH